MINIKNTSEKTLRHTSHVPCVKKKKRKIKREVEKTFLNETGTNDVTIFIVQSLTQIVK